MLAKGKILSILILVITLTLKALLLYLWHCSPTPGTCVGRKSCCKLLYVILVKHNEQYPNKICQLPWKSTIKTWGMPFTSMVSLAKMFWILWSEGIQRKDWKLAKVAKKAINYWGVGGGVRHCSHPVWILCLPKRNSRNEAILEARCLVIQKVGGIWKLGIKEFHGGVAGTRPRCSECNVSVVPPDLRTSMCA